jgi:hypothetical protein
MPSTAAQYGVADRRDPETNVHAGARYLRELIEKFSGDVPLALAAYNAGPEAVRRVHGIPQNGETPLYVRRVLRLWREPGLSIGSSVPSARELAQMLGFMPSSDAGITR